MSSSLDLLNDEELLYRKANLLRLLEKTNEEITARGLDINNLLITEKENKGFLINSETVSENIVEKKKFTIRIKKTEFESEDDSCSKSNSELIPEKQILTPRVKFRVKKS